MTNQPSPFEQSLAYRLVLGKLTGDNEQTKYVLDDLTEDSRKGGDAISTVLQMLATSVCDALVEGLGVEGATAHVRGLIPYLPVGGEGQTGAAKYMVEHESGDIALIDEPEIEAEARHLAAIMLTMEKFTGENAGAELLQIGSRSGSPAYTRALAQRACERLVTYALDETPTFALPIVLGNLNKFILSYRILKPASTDDATPGGDEDDPEDG